MDGWDGDGCGREMDGRENGKRRSGRDMRETRGMRNVGGMRDARDTKRMMRKKAGRSDAGRM